MDVTVNNALFNRLTTVIESMPAFPESVNQVISMTSDINCAPKHMELGDGGNPCVGELPEFICQRLGADLKAIVPQMGGLSGEIQAMKGMVQG